MKTNPWVKYTDRTFLSIKESVLNRLRVSVPELTDFSPSNLLVIIVDMFAGISEMIHYYIDITARELFVPTAQRFSSILKLAEQSGYLGKARIPSRATLLFSFEGDEPCPSDFVIPLGSIFTSSQGQSWVLDNNVLFREGYYKALGYATQYSQISDLDIGESDGEANQSFLLPPDYAHGSLDVVVGAEPWNHVDSLGFSKAIDKDFIVQLKSDGAIYLVFGDGSNGAIPQSGLSILISYRSTDGLGGRIGRGEITTITSVIPNTPVGVTLKVTNPNPSFAGKGVERMEDVRRAIPISLRTLERAVTRQDYIDIASSAPGVKAAVLAFDCGLGVDLYIVPEGGGVPNASFLLEVEQYVKTRSIATIPVSCKPSGETRLKMRLEVTGRYRVSAQTISLKTKQKLESLYHETRTAINQAIRLSDIIAAVDNLPEVDFLHLKYLYAVPYLRPHNLTSNLGYKIEVLPTSMNENSWKLVWMSDSSTFTLFRNGSLVSTGLGVGAHTGLGGLIDLEILGAPTGVNPGDYWEFKTYPYTRDIILSDYTVPTINPSDLIIEPKEQYV